jgi:iron complex transport system substrate-binding protein
MSLLVMLCALIGSVDAIEAQESAPQALPPKPQRIVSLNLCTDQLLMLLVEPERIAGVTYLASQPDASPMAENARDLPVTHGVAEEVIARKPDLVVAGVYTTRTTVAILRRLGFKVVEFEPETSIADIPRHIRQMGRAVGEPQRAEEVIETFERDLAAVEAGSASGRRPVFTDYGANGFTSGAGTLEEDVARAAGYDLLGAKLGIQGSANVPLETLLTSSVDVITLSHPTSGFPALAEERLRHPALQRYVQARTVIDIPPPLWDCGTPYTLEAVRRLALAAPQGQRS